MEPITTTLTVSSVYTTTLPSGGTGAIVATVTFGDVMVTTVLLFLLFYLVVNGVAERRRAWRS